MRKKGIPTRMGKKLGFWAQDTFFAMGTFVTHSAYGMRAKRALSRAKAETLRLERLFSRFLPSSEIGRLNACAGTESVCLSPETWDLLSFAVEMSRLSGGCFDITVGPLTRLWSAHLSGKPIPEAAELQAAAALVGCQFLRLDAAGKTARLAKPGQSVDLGGIGKGYAADRIAEVFRNHGIACALTNFGGNVAAVGARPDGSPWRIGIRHPRRPDCLLGAVEVADRSVVTSGDDQRCRLDAQGRRYHHIVDPATGRPSEAGLVSVTVIAPSSTTADALSTCLFLSGPEKGKALLVKFPGIQAILVDAESTVHMTQGLRESFHPAEPLQTRWI